MMRSNPVSEFTRANCILTRAATDVIKAWFVVCDAPQGWRWRAHWLDSPPGTERAGVEGWWQVESPARGPGPP
jgi:hypothetical protein